MTEITFNEVITFHEVLLQAFKNYRSELKKLGIAVVYNDNGIRLSNIKTGKTHFIRYSDARERWAKSYHTSNFGSINKEIKDAVRAVTE